MKVLGAVCCAVPLHEERAGPGQLLAVRGTAGAGRAVPRSGRVSPSPAAAPCRGVCCCQSLCWAHTHCAHAGLRGQPGAHTHTHCAHVGLKGRAAALAPRVGQCVCSCSHPRCCSELFHTDGLCCLVCIAWCASLGRGVSRTRRVKRWSFKCSFQINQPVFSVDM